MGCCVRTLLEAKDHFRMWLLCAVPSTRDYARTTIRLGFRIFIQERRLRSLKSSRLCFMQARCHGAGG